MLRGGAATVAASELVKSAGIMLMANSAANKAEGYERGKSDPSREKTDQIKPLSSNQLNKMIHTGKTPKGIKRFDTPKIKGEQNHVHFDDGSALNIDGTWKHGQRELNRETIVFLKQNGYNIQ